MFYPCAHAFRHQVIPFSVNDMLTGSCGLYKPNPIRDDTGARPIEIGTALKRIADKYDEAPLYHKRLMLEIVLAVPDTDARDPVKVSTRDSSSSSTQRLPSMFEHVESASDFPVERQRCRICLKPGHKAHECHP